MTEQEIKTLFMIAVAIVFGAIAHVAHWVMSKEEETITRIIIISSIIVSCFAWGIFWLLVSTYTDSLTYIILASSLGAYMWDKGIEKVWEKILKLIWSK